MFRMLKAFLAEVFGFGEEPEPNPPEPQGKFIFQETWAQWREVMRQITTEEREQDQRNQQTLQRIQQEKEALEKQLPYEINAKAELLRREINKGLKSLEEQKYAEENRYCKERGQRKKIQEIEKRLREEERERVPREGVVISTTPRELPQERLSADIKKFLIKMTVEERRIVQLKDGRYFLCVFESEGIMKETGRTAQVCMPNFGKPAVCEKVMEWTGLCKEPKLTWVTGDLVNFTEDELKLIAER